MNASKPGNAATSASTSSSGPPNPNPSKHGPISEAAFLQQRAQTAREAIHATLDEIKTEFSQGLSPIELAKRHPWLTLLGSAVGGFAAAATLVPSKEQQALDRLRRVQEALHPSTKPAAGENGNKPHEKGSKISSVLITQLLGMLRPIVISLISGAMASRSKPPEDPTQNPPGFPAASGTDGPSPL
jgi:hypothetical protein